MASKRGHSTICELLLNRGADVNEKDEVSITETDENLLESFVVTDVLIVMQGGRTVIELAVNEGIRALLLVFMNDESYVLK
jgi:hypothetical protein